MAAAVPVIVCMKSEYNNKYLRYKNDSVQTHGLLQFAADKVMDPYAQFEIEKSEVHDGLIHLKSRYNNKYFVRWSPGHHWITASAHTIDEDQNNWTCTLFKPIYIGDPADHKLRLVHVQLGHYASLWRVGGSFDSCLYAGSKEIDRDSTDVINLVNWKSLFSLPRQVAFKSIINGKYLGAYTTNGIPYLQFSSTDPSDPRAAHELFTAGDGTVCVKSGHFGKFWRLGNGDWIVVDADDPRDTGNTEAMFRPAVIDTNVIALLNMSKTWFCKRFTHRGLESCLNAATENVDEEAKFEVIDLQVN